VTDASAATPQQRLCIDEDVCAGHGRCYSLEPELFDSDDAGYPLVRHETLPAALLVRASHAVGNCPEGAVSLRLVD
jgi:ferredoxin